MLNKLSKLLVVSLVVFFNFSTIVFAEDDANVSDTGGEGGTILPATNKSTQDCKALMNSVHSQSAKVKEEFKKRSDSEFDLSAILGCGIKTGNISLWMVPYYIRYILEFVIQLGGLVGVGGIIYGGYLYLFAGVSEDKDRGKKALIYSISGIALTLVAWAFVNIIIAIVTA